MLILSFFSFGPNRFSCAFYSNFRVLEHLRIHKEMMLFTLAIILLTSCMATDAEYVPLFKCTKNLKNAYGLCSHINRRGEKFEYDSREKDITMANAIGTNYVRTDFDWVVCQPKEGTKFVFEQHDSMMKTITEHNIGMLGILTPTMRTLSDWKKYVSILSSHNNSHIKYWEVVNEVDRVHKWLHGFKLSSYTELLRLAYIEIKMNSKKQQVLFSGLANACGGEFEQLLEDGVGNYFDIMNVHWYANKEQEPEKIIDFLINVSDIMKKHGIKKPIWITETGCTSAQGWASEKTQAERLPRLFLISYACGVDKVFWYKSRSNEFDKDDRECFFGLWHQDYSPKPAFYAYQTLTRMCPNKATRPRLQRNDGVYVASWKRPDGKKVCALWTSGNSVRVNLSIKKGYTAYSLYGREMRINPDDFEVSQSVVYIVGTENFKLKRL